MYRCSCILIVYPYMYSVSNVFQDGYVLHVTVTSHVIVPLLFLEEEGGRRTWHSVAKAVFAEGSTGHR